MSHTLCALVAYVNCDGRKKELDDQLLNRSEEKTNVFMKKTIDNSKTCKIKMQQEGNSEWDKYKITHKELCEHNGAKRLGSLGYGFKHVDCKKPQIITIEAGTERDTFDLDNCHHSGKCS